MIRTYGTISILEGKWLIKTEPHVAMKLRRVFARVAKVGDILLNDSIENCHELLWFTERYPMVIGDADLRRLKRQSKKFVELIKTREQILGGFAQSLEHKLAVPARAYQEQAARLLLEQGFLLLADDVGLGKSCSAICALIDPRTRPALVVTLAHLPRQWAAEFQKFAPGIKTHILKTAKPYDLPPGIDVLICNYHKLSGWCETLKDMMKSVVFDECQELRRGDSDKYTAAKIISGDAKYCLGLSATPIFNFGGEMINVMGCIKPDALGNHEEFNREWCDGGSIKNPKAFGTWLREQGIMLRRTRKDVGRELPPLQNIIHVIDSDAKALDSVKGQAAELARIIMAEAPATRDERFNAGGRFEAIMRQATGIAKAPYVADFVRILIESGEKVVLFGWHRAVYDIWADKLADFKPVFYTGEETANQKDGSKNKFTTGESPLIIVSLRAGAGLDGLQNVSRTCVIGELDWSPGVHTQNVGRIYRDGQSDSVTAYFMVAKDGADPVMSDVCGLKKQQSDGICDPDKDLFEKIISSGDHVKKLAEHYLAHVHTRKRVVDFKREDLEELVEF